MQEKFNIPELGDKIVLVKKFNFSLIFEQRNLAFIHHCDNTVTESSCYTSWHGYQEGFKYSGCVPFPVIEDFEAKWPSNKNKLHMEQRAYKEYAKAMTAYNAQVCKEYSAWQKERAFNTFLPKGTVLTVDRIYIRKGAKDFSSVTFKTVLNNKTYRFWLHLSDVNRICWTRG